MCRANTNGDQLNSCELSFYPKTLRMGNFNLNVNSQTAAYGLIRLKKKIKNLQLIFFNL
jgi:RNA 3'-terminal phosphate cyclase